MKLKDLIDNLPLNFHFDFGKYRFGDDPEPGSCIVFSVYVFDEGYKFSAFLTEGMITVDNGNLCFNMSRFNCGHILDAENGLDRLHWWLDRQGTEDYMSIMLNRLMENNPQAALIMLHAAWTGTSNAGS